jgi:hypothetical protein
MMVIQHGIDPFGMGVRVRQEAFHILYKRRAITGIR